MVNWSNHSIWRGNFTNQSTGFRRDEGLVSSPIWQFQKGFLLCKFKRSGVTKGSGLLVEPFYFRGNKKQHWPVSLLSFSQSSVKFWSWPTPSGIVPVQSQVKTASWRRWWTNHSIWWVKLKWHWPKSSQNSKKGVVVDWLTTLFGWTILLHVIG